MEAKGAVYFWLCIYYLSRFLQTPRRKFRVGESVRRADFVLDAAKHQAIWGRVIKDRGWSSRLFLKRGLPLGASKDLEDGVADDK